MSARRARFGRRCATGLLVTAVATGSAVTALALAGPTSQPVGPFDARLSLTPSLSGGSSLKVPPLGDLQFATHAGPVGLQVRLEEVRPRAVQNIADDPDLDALGTQVRDDLRRAVLLLLGRDAALAVAGASLGGFVVLRSRRRAVQAGAVAVGLLLVTSGVAATTFRTTALAEPEFTGVLAYAPAVIGDTRNVVARLNDYSQQLGRLVTNVSTLYAAASTLPSYRATPGTVRVLHVSDLHLSPSAYRIIGSVAEQFSVDFVLDTGDIADHGSAAEDAYVTGIGELPLPYVYVRGNHDSVGTETAVRSQPNAVVLDDGLPVTVAGLTVMGQADPRFTPDKRTRDDTVSPEVLLDVGRHLRAVARLQDRPPDLVAVHDPKSAVPLLGAVPLVLAGHTHDRKVSVEDGTRLMVQGSTGGAGLRALEGDTPTPVQMTVLYVDRATGALQAYDEITLGGLGLSDARIRRQVVGGEDLTAVAGTGSPPAGSPSPAPGAALPGAGNGGAPTPAPPGPAPTPTP